MILLNFSHPITSDQLAQIEALVGEPVARVTDIVTQLDVLQPFGPQVVALADSAGLTPAEWQTLPLLINPPALSAIAVTLLAELHGRMGYFPTAIRLRQTVGTLPPRFEVAELLSLQTVRDAARLKR